MFFCFYNNENIATHDNIRLEFNLYPVTLLQFG